MFCDKKYQDGLEPITAKAWMVKNWDKYEMPSIESKEEFIGLLNILQSHNLTLEDMHDCVCNGYDEFMYFWNHEGWETMDDLYRAICQYNSFYTEEEFTEWIIEQVDELKSEGWDDPIDEIKSWTYGKDFMYEGWPTDTMIFKTEDGYVRQITY